MSGCQLAVRGATLPDGRGKGRRVDLLVARGKVLELAPAAGKTPAGEAEEIDASGLVLLPSLTDAHTHLREPGYEYKEDIASGLSAAAHGGFGNVMCMANTNPVNDSASVTELMLDRAKDSWPRGPRLFPIGALTRGLAGRELAPMAELAEAGCVAFSNDGVPVSSSEVMRRAMEYASDLGRRVIDHCEDPSMNPASGVNDGVLSGRLGLDGQPDVAETIQAARDVLLAEYLDLPVHLAHVSCRRTVELIAWAKSRGVRVTAETCPHYLLLTEERAAGFDSLAKVNPPLRTRDDVLALRQAVREGVVDILVTDHAPHADCEKEVEFDAAPCGVCGLDTALALTWTLVREGELTAGDLVRLWAEAPCGLFDLPLNRFRPGDPADFVLFDPGRSWLVCPDSLHSKAANTPFLGRTLEGRVRAHFLGGRKIV